MFTAKDYEDGKSVYECLILHLPRTLNQWSIEAHHSVGIGVVNDNTSAVIAAFTHLEKTNPQFSSLYSIDVKRGIITLDEKIASRADQIDKFLRDNRYTLIGTEFTVESEWDASIMDVRGFVLKPDKNGKVTIQLKPEPDYI